MADHMRTELVTGALDAAIIARGGDVAGVIAHADRGSQYTSNDYLDFCQRHQLRPSVGRVATCFDNAVAESFWASLKRECIQGRVFNTCAEARRAIFKWIKLVQHHQTPLEPRLHRPHRLGTSTPTSVITTVRSTGRCPMIRRYIHWRNRHAHDQALRHLINRATLPDAALAESLIDRMETAPLHGVGHPWQGCDHARCGGSDDLDAATAGALDVLRAARQYRPGHEARTQITTS